MGESTEQPTRYYRNNLDSALAVVEAMQAHNVKNIVFSSSATVYGPRAPVPYQEDYQPLEATNPYGETKIMIERILTDTAAANPGWNTWSSSGAQSPDLAYARHGQLIGGESPLGEAVVRVPQLTAGLARAGGNCVIVRWGGEEARGETLH